MNICLLQSALVWFFVVFVLLHLYTWWQYIHGRVRLLFILSSTVCRLFCKYISVSMQVILSKFCIYIHQKNICDLYAMSVKYVITCLYIEQRCFILDFQSFFFLLAFLYWVILVYRDSYLILTILFKYWCLHVNCRIINGGQFL